MKAFAIFLTSLLVHSSWAVPTGFVDEGISIVPAISGAFVPNPRLSNKPMLLIAAKEGTVHVLEDPDNSDVSMQVFNISAKLCTNGPRGLMTIRPHPDFVTNRYIFMYYMRIVPNCPEDAVLGPSNRLSRFTMNPTTLQIDPNSEVVYLETPPSTFILHDGGGMVIGNDRLLYLAIGDSGSREYAPNRRTLYGKLIRLDLNGNVPASNPYTVASGGTGVACRKNKGVPPTSAPSNAVCEEIIAFGLRNPFRMGYDVNSANKVRISIGDVGASDWEELSYGGTDYLGTNYGWETFEGPCIKGSTTNCPVHGAGLTEPFYYWEHAPGVQGGAITASAFVPTGLWPAQYQFLYADYISATIYNLKADAGRACRTCKPPLPAFRNETFHRAEKVVEMFFGPYKETTALYYLTKAAGQNVRRIRATGSTNRAPIAKITVAKTNLLVNETLTFQGSGSSDPDGDALTYLWVFDDGRTSTAVNPVRSYTAAGTYQVTLTVKDTSGLSSQAYATIIVGSKPTVTMLTPKTYDGFIVGQKLRLKGNGTDSTGAAIPNSGISWEVLLRHATHFHPFLDRTVGNDFDLYPAPGPEELSAALNSYLVVSVTATDRFGVSSTKTRSVKPILVNIDIASVPTGLQVVVDYTTLTTPVTVTTWQNHKLRLTANDQASKMFSKWSIGGNRTTFYTVPTQAIPNTKITATFVSA